ncbi:GNAT family N-acetyltransferase [Hymenobacter sp. PAMC 26628]|uniref:GNAT family N-acetyltransferase n=1 Tax=Hymenobacter sp. PAMC 26628 TaxID=1484118 RepID=UPI000770396A|nr:GNAT family N-acetyltransferase [Hymenobacter sp. PAMC 26628]AMJ67054.1 acetyltransferase [Hymenobacter sp. PAMC 26628]
MDVRTRLATLGDVPALSRLVGLAVSQLSAGYYTGPQIESALRYLFGIDTQLVVDGTYYVAEIDGQLAGCGGWSRRQTLYGGDQSKAAADPLLDPARDVGRIRAFFVHPGRARRGVGRAIIGVCEGAADAAGFRSLALAATLPGEPLYRALGYAAGARSFIHFPDGEQRSIVEMHKLLS